MKTTTLSVVIRENKCGVFTVTRHTGTGASETDEVVSVAAGLQSAEAALSAYLAAEKAYGWGPAERTFVRSHTGEWQSVA